jgi:DNA-directed RNA polymerase subunit E'/Rpb7
MDLSFISNQKLSTKINLKPNELNKNINEIIFYKLKTQNEGFCIKEGYIIKNSIEIINKSMGHIVNLNNKSYIQYSINYKSIILSPKENDIINCYIDNINKLGIVAYIKLSELLNSIYIDKINDTFNNSPVVIIIPEINIDDITKYNSNDNINVKINAVRIKYNSDKIQLIATLI